LGYECIGDDNLKQLVASEDQALKQQESSSRKAGERAF
jgi:hypothetical protein